MTFVRLIGLILLLSNCICRSHGNQQLQVQHHLADLLTRLTQMVDHYEDKSDQMSRLELLIRCHPPSTLVNGHIEELVVENKLVLKFSCKKQGSLKGSEVLECDKGVWNGSIPICTSSCKVPKEVESIVKDKTVSANGQIEVNFTCPKGDSLQGSEFLTCDHSSGWSSSFPCCYTFKLGDVVRVKPSVSTPHFAWGKADHDSVGPITKLEPNKIWVKFPKQSGWMARPEEMDLIPPVNCSAMHSIK